MPADEYVTTVAPVSSLLLGFVLVGGCYQGTTADDCDSACGQTSAQPGGDPSSDGGAGDDGADDGGDGTGPGDDGGSDGGSGPGGTDDGGDTGAPTEPTQGTLDLATLSTEAGGLRRVYGSVGDGSRGVAVAGGHDLDGDGNPDYALAAMLSSPQGRVDAGQVFVTFGTGAIEGTLDTAASGPGMLVIHGDDRQENAGSELWMDDVTGDGLGDLLVARQNHTPTTGRTGAGALSVIVGSSALRDYAATGQPLDLRSPPASITIVTLLGPTSLDRLGIWMRTGDVDGDGTADIAVGADQESNGGDAYSGAVYVVRGGSHLAQSRVVDLASFGSTALAGNIAKLLPPTGADGYHFGATVQIGDLDGNGRSEVIVAAALNRAGAGLDPFGGSGTAEGTGGSRDGSLFVTWDDNFPSGAWPAGMEFRVNDASGGYTRIDGDTRNVSFGEEILAGLDYDGDGAADLFVGDIVADLTGSRSGAGSGHVFYDAENLKNRTLDLGQLPGDVVTTTIIGAEPGAIAADTAAHGDFDGDGFADLAVGSPGASPANRHEAGTMHVFLGQPGGWPETIDLAAPPTSFSWTEVHGAQGEAGNNLGDMICYSAASGDVDGDGTVDLIINEMTADGLAPGAVDVGNLIVLGGPLMRAP